MPDWMTHLVIGLIMAELINSRKKSPVLLGALLPDILSKFNLLFFYLGMPSFIGFGSFHTPAVCFLFAILASSLFAYNRPEIFKLIMAGLFSHFLIDLMLKHFVGGVMLFFPFSTTLYRLGLFWSDQSWYLLVESLIIYFIIKLGMKHTQGLNKNIYK